MIDREDVKSRAKKTYEDLDAIWPETDAWSTHTRTAISKIIDQSVDQTCLAILNVGCGNNDYGLSARAVCLNLDLSLHQCRKVERSVVADVEAIPFCDRIFDATICVGAVLNYVEPYDAIPELTRVTKPRGLLIVDFETTTTAELLFSNQWGRRVSVVERGYAGRRDKTFLFSAEHIKRILAQNQVEVTATHHYHLATAMWSRVFPYEKYPKAIFSMDTWLSRVRGLRSLSSNVTFVGRKS